MRRESRTVLAMGLLFLMGMGGGAARQDGKPTAGVSKSESVRMTIDLSWALVSGKLGDGSPQPDGSGVELELSEGRVVDAIVWPPGLLGQRAVPQGWGPSPSGGWRLGGSNAGRVRARIEAPVDARLIVRDGDQLVSVPVFAILDRAQHNPDTALLRVTVERLAWDALSVSLGESASDGIVEPGAKVPISVGLNLLWPESTDVAVHYSAVIRPAKGGEPLGRQDGQEVLATNRREVPVRLLNLRAPGVEGAYVVEVRANWEPITREGSRLGRLIRRHKPATAATSSVRRTALVVIARRGAVQPAEGTLHEHRRGGSEVAVDSVDLSRPRVHRLVATGRSPLAETGRSTWDVPAEALIEPSGRNRLRGWFLRNEGESGRLEAASSAGLAWSAVGLRAARPDRPHRLTLSLKGGEPSSLGVALIEAAETGAANPRPRVLLDACASGPPVLENGPTVSFSWYVWPGSAENVLVVYNRSTEAAVRLGTITLTELDDLPGPPPIRTPKTTSTRTLGFSLEGAHPLDPFGGDASTAEVWTAASNLARYLTHCGASAVVVPESFGDRVDRRALDGQAHEDSCGPDRLELVRRLLKRQGSALWLELAFDGPDALPGLPPPDSSSAAERGLVRLDGHGQPVGSAYHPLNPEVRQAMRQRVVEAMGRLRSDGPADPRTAPGLVIRLGRGPTMLGTPDTGIDDTTYARFVRETFSADTARNIPGLANDDPGRFAVRHRYLAGAGRMPWLTWRARAMATLYADLGAAAQETVPGAMLAVVTPGLNSGPAGVEARRVDLAGLAPSQAWRSVGLDLASWPTGPAAPAVLRGTTLSVDALAHDLATSPDLDAIVAGRPRRGLFLTVDGSSSPAPGLPAGAAASPRTSSVRLHALPLGGGPTADEPLSHALAALDAHWVILSAAAAAGHEDRLRNYAGVIRSLPSWPTRPVDRAADPRTPVFGTSVRTSGDDTQSFVAIANDSPYPIRIACLVEAPDSAVIEDLGRGLRLAPTREASGRNLVLDLIPYGVSAIRVGAPGIRIASVNTYPSEAILASMEARSHELSLQLARLNQATAGASVEPGNPGFEPMDESHRGATAGPATATGPGGEALPALPGDSDPAVTTAGGIGPIGAETLSVAGGWKLEVSPAAGREGEVQGGQGARAPAGSPGRSIAIDPVHPHTGRGSLRLSAPEAPISVVSAPFAPAPQTSLTIQAYFRSEPANATVRVWIEGQSNGQPYVRRSVLEISSAWEPRAVRAADLPAAGLDSARLRFEMMTPGILWIDDLKIGSDAAARSARLNARRTVLAALQAYREHRYADFARLAGSHWVRESAVTAARIARSNDVHIGTGAAETEASALSRDRALR